MLKRKGRELEMACKQSNMNADNLALLVSTFNKFLTWVIKGASTDDLTSVQRIAARPNALTKAASTVDRLKQNAANDEVVYHIPD